MNIKVWISINLGAAAMQSSACLSRPTSGPVTSVSLKINWSSLGIHSLIMNGLARVTIVGSTGLLLVIERIFDTRHKSVYGCVFRFSYN